jgi:hypothetical protein
MKYILILVPLIFFACVSSKIKNRSNITTYNVYKIDSVNTYYLIYTKKNDTIYKIVSKKEIMDRGQKIQLNRMYAFELHSILSEFRIGNATVSPKTSNINCFAFDEKTNICLEGDSIKDLYSANNIKGLYYIKN